jgi:APA family basic amino acid/polyamine antiporter
MFSMHDHDQGDLRRTIGTGGAVLLGLGSIIGTGVFVSIALATELTGSWVLVAIAIATLTATCNGLSSAQLAAVFPVSGGTYEYGVRLLTPTAGFTAGWMFLCAKSASAAAAALGAAAYLLSLLGYGDSGAEVYLAVLLLLLATVTVLTGLRASVLVTMCILTLAGIGLGVFLLAGIDAAPSDGAMRIPSDATAIPGAAALMFVAFTGYGRIATLGEEVRAPARSIPRAIIITLVCAGVLYMLVGWAIVRTAMPEDLLTTGPVLNPLQSIATRVWSPAAGTAIAVAAVAAMIGVLLNLLLGLSRVMLAMARRGDMPRRCGQLSERTATPQIAVIVIACLIGVLVCVGGFTFAWSLSACTVLIYYALTNAAALRLTDQQRTKPRWVSILGLLLCGGLAFSLPVATWSIGLAVLVSGLVWRWARHLVRTDPLQ